MKHRIITKKNLIFSLVLSALWLILSNPTICAALMLGPPPTGPQEIILDPAEIMSDESQIKFNWQVDPADVDISAVEFRLIISDQPDLNPDKSKWLETIPVIGKTQYTLTEHQALPAGREFYWQIGVYGGFPIMSDIGTVQVAIDDLILQYEPVLYLHPDENYYPTLASDFAEASSLWDKGDDEKPILEEDNVNLDQLGNYSDEAYYLQFVEELVDKEPDPGAALAEFNNLRAQGKFPYAYYAYKMSDYDEVHEQEYIVLQYWFFYVFNDWREQVGWPKAVNNHEGDWEVVMVFLDALTEMPQYAAYSQHHNAGEQEWTKFQYDIVRREWSEIEADDGHPKVFVALGSHANYINTGNHSIFVISVDKTSDQGNIITDSNGFIFITNHQTWLDYKGNWGVWADKEGFNGPQGPKFSEYNKFKEPIKWAGIDKVKTEEIETGVEKEIELEKLTLTINPEQNGKITISPHQEFLQSNDESKVLPRYYQIKSDITDFNAELKFKYSEAELKELNISEDELEVLRYDEKTKKWLAVESVIDKVNNIITGVIDHFSIYSLGVSLSQFNNQITDSLSAQVNNIAYDEDDLILSFDLNFKNISQSLNLPIHFIITKLENGINLENPDGINLDENLFIEFGHKGQILENNQSTDVKNIKLQLPAPQCVLIEYEIFGE